MEAGFTEGRHLIAIGQVKVTDETEISGQVNWFQPNIRSKWKRMTVKLGKLICWGKSGKVSQQISNGLRIFIDSSVLRVRQFYNCFFRS